MSESEEKPWFHRVVDSHWECESCGGQRFKLVQRTDRGTMVAKKVNGKLDLVEERDPTPLEVSPKALEDDA